MGESLLLYERCLAIQLARETPPPSRPPGPHQSRPTTSRDAQPNHPHALRRPPTRPHSLPDHWADLATSPNSDSDTPTPTNNELDGAGWSVETASLAPPASASKDTTKITNYQDGYLLFLVSVHLGNVTISMLLRQCMIRKNEDLAVAWLKS